MAAGPPNLIGYDKMPLLVTTDLLIDVPKQFQILQSRLRLTVVHPVLLFSTSVKSASNRVLPQPRI